MAEKPTYEELEDKVQKIEDAATEYKRIKETLRESEERYRKLLEKSKKAEEVYNSLIHYSANGVVICDMEGKATYFSPVFGQAFEWPSEEVKGTRIPSLPGSENHETTSSIKDLINKETLCHGLEIKRYLKDGTLRDISPSTCRFDDHEERCEAMLFVLRDISEAKKLQDQLQHLQKMAHIGTIAKEVAHGFNNVLSGISLSSQIIKMRYQDDPALIQIAERINKAVKRGAGLVDGLMYFARKETINEFNPLDVTQVLRETYDLMITKRFDRKIDIIMDVPELPRVMGDHSGLRHVFLNLCTNARDSMPEGGRLNINAQKNGNQVEISISDTGHGMDQETQKKCFDPFFAAKMGYKGTVLGLSMAFDIVKRHGGHIHVDSELNRGSTFRVSLPIATSGKGSAQKSGPAVIHESDKSC